MFASCNASGRGHADGFDDVSHIAGWIPQRVDRLRLADAVHGSHLEIVIAGCELHREPPFAEGIFAEVFPERRPRPALSAVGRDRDFGNAVAAVERDAFEQSLAADFYLRPVLDVGDEG